MSQMPPVATPSTTPGSLVAPHRGTTVLVLGILALVFLGACGIGLILGIIAWVMGNSDLRAMAAGQMDRSGEGMTKAGKICGMVAVIVFIALTVLYGVLMILGLGVGFIGAATGAGGP